MRNGWSTASVPNDAPSVLEVLARYREAIGGIVVESTYNWYWLVDALMEAGYRVHRPIPPPWCSTRG